MRSASGNPVTAAVALATCRELPQLDEDTRRLLEPLAARGVSVAPAIWNDERVDWTQFDLVVVRSCWDYVEHRTEFLRWSRRVPHLANPASVLAWNADKRYLRSLADVGIPTIPTSWISPGDRWCPPHHGEIVIKPTVSLCALNTGRYRMDDPTARNLAREHVWRLQSTGCVTMVQPYLQRLDDEGETSLVFLGGRLTHAIRKEAILTGPDAGADRRFEPGGGQRLTSRTCTAEQLELAARVLRAVPGGPVGLLYARVDLVPDDSGRPVLMEVELIEPQLYLAHAAGAAEAMATAIVESAGRCCAARAS